MRRLRFLLRGALTLLLCVGGSLLMLAVAIPTLCCARRFYSERIASPLGRLVLATWGVRVVVHPPAAAPSGPCVYISNHTSTLDLFVLIALGLPRTRFFLSGFLQKFIPIAIIGRLIGIFWTVDQAYPERRRRIFARADRILRRSGDSVYLSPEGQRVVDGNVGHFNKGAFHLAISLQRPLVPFYIAVPRAQNPGLGLEAQPCTVQVHCHEPIPTSGWRIDQVEELRDAVRERFLGWHREHAC